MTAAAVVQEQQVSADSAVGRRDRGLHRESALELVNISKTYPGRPPVHALRDVSLRVLPAELVAVAGPSGSGKSTFLHVAGTLERPSNGTLRIAGEDVSSLIDRDLSSVRAQHIGFVFQQFHLLENEGIVENVAQGLLYRGLRRGARRREALKALARVGLGDRVSHRPSELSGGERQRVAIARALVGRPALVLADEPTGNLDSATGAALIDLLRELNAEGTTIIVVTHEAEVAAAMMRQVVMRDGRIVSDSGTTADGPRLLQSHR
jgi:putative ABC transport system ATP-binding protein